MLCIVHAHCGQHQYLLRHLGFPVSSFNPAAPPDRSRNDEGKAAEHIRPQHLMMALKQMAHLFMAGRSVQELLIYMKTN